MSRGGKLAPEVNRYVAQNSGWRRERGLIANVLAVPQSFVRQESKVYPSLASLPRHIGEYVKDHVVEACADLG